MLEELDLVVLLRELLVETGDVLGEDGHLLLVVMGCRVKFFFLRVQKEVLELFEDMYRISIATTQKNL